MEYSIGDKIGGRYEVHRIFGGQGRSGMGVVYVCYDHRDGGVLALKTYQEGFFHDKLLVDHFKRGAVAWIQLERHPYVVRALGVLKLAGQLFLGLEYVAPDELGRNNLRHHLHAGASLETILTWGIQFCDAMEHARLKKITPHRDIKPDNILITHNNILKVSDFDLAGNWQGEGRPLAVPSADKGADGMTFIRDADDQGVMGTLPWMAPEQFAGKASVQSDLYSFGIILYQLSHNGALPYQPGPGGDWGEVHRNALAPQMDGPLAPVIRRLLAKDPQARYGGGQAEKGFVELREALADLFQQQFTFKSLPTPPQAAELQVEDLNDRGVSLAYLGLHKAALKAYKQAMDLKPKHAPTYLNLGVALYEMGENEKAGQAYRKALKLDPDMAEAHHNFAMFNKKLGELEEAEQHLREAIRLDPHMHSAYEQLGVLTSESGRHQEAIALMQDAIRRDPLHAAYHYSLGVALENAGQYPQSLASYQEAVRLNPRDGLNHYGLGNAYRHLGDMQQAVACWQRTAELDPRHAMVRFNLGLFYEQAGDKPTSYGYYRQATEIDPQTPNPYYNLALMLAGEKLFGEGADAFENFARYAADDPAMAPHVAKAQGYIPMMRQDEATMQAEMVHHQAVYNRGLAYMNLGRMQEAREWFEKALAMNPAYPHALCGLGICHERQERPDLAIDCYRKSIEVDPGYVIAWNNLGWANYLNGDYPEAAKAYRQFIQVAASQFPDWVANARQMLAKMGQPE